MENKAILEKIEKSTRQQALCTKILCVLCTAVLLCALVMTAAVASTAGQVMEVVTPLQNVATQVQNIATQVHDMTGQAGTIMDNMEAVTQALADADLGTMVENVNTLTAQSQTVVSEAMEKLDTIDIDTLNKAINDLSDVVEPLARVTNFFG